MLTMHLRAIFPARSLKMAVLRLRVTLLRVRHEQPVNHWLATRAQYRQDHDWL